MSRVRGKGRALAASTGHQQQHRTRGQNRRPTVHAAVEAFLQASAWPRSANTQRAYQFALTRLATWLGPRRSLATVSDEELEQALHGLWGQAAAATWNRNRAAARSWLAWCAGQQHWVVPTLPTTVARRPGRPTRRSTVIAPARIHQLCTLTEVPLRERALWRLLYESAARATAVLALNVEDLDQPRRQAPHPQLGEPAEPGWIVWGEHTAALLAELLGDRHRGPLFLTERRPSARRASTLADQDRCPDTGHARLGYDRTRMLFHRYSGGLQLHQLRHSAATHLGEAGHDATTIMAKTGHKSLRSVQSYTHPTLAAAHEATASLATGRADGTTTVATR